MSSHDNMSICQNTLSFGDRTVHTANLAGFLENVATDLQPGAHRIDENSAREPACTGRVIEGGRKIDAALPHPLAAPSTCDPSAAPLEQPGTVAIKTGCEPGPRQRRDFPTPT